MHPVCFVLIQFQSIALLAIPVPRTRPRHAAKFVVIDVRTEVMAVLNK
jgi:hypothetical protein